MGDDCRHQWVCVSDDRCSDRPCTRGCARIDECAKCGATRTVR